MFKVCIYPNCNLITSSCDIISHYKKYHSICIPVNKNKKIDKFNFKINKVKKIYI